MRAADREAWIERARDVPILSEIARRGIKLKRVGAERVGPCPLCGGRDRFSIHTKKQCWNCRQCKKESDTGDVIGFVQWLDNCDFNTACATLTGEPPPKKANSKHRGAVPKQVIAGEYSYCDEVGNVLFVVERHHYQNADGLFVLKDGKHQKTFKQKRPDPDRRGKWINNVEGARAVPYRLPEVIAAIANGQPVAVVEGEGKADLLASWSLTATTNAGGAKHWNSEHAKFLKNADVILVPDNDDAGWEHINIVGASLIGIAKRIRVLVLPGLPDKGNIVDWARAGGTREQLNELITKAPDWMPTVDGIAKEKKAAAKQSEDELLDALARMPKGVARGRERKRLAEQLGVNASDIDAEIEARQVEAETNALLHGWWFVDPWPEPVDGDALIRDIIRKLHKHVVMSSESALAIALWIILAWVHDSVAVHSPILDITSAEPESGKTTLLSLVAFLVPRAISSVDISRGALYRAIQRWQPSFAIDEFDDVLAARGDSNKTELRSVINSGHTRGQGVLRCVTDEHRPELFSTFAPKCIGMVGKRMPATTLGRCIVVELRRRRDDEQIIKFSHEDDSELADLRSRLRR